jgi:hypothetical protein
MSLLTFEETRPWARAIKDRVQKREIPPWFADPKFGHFSNDRSLSSTDIDTFVKWADGGTIAGRASEAPPRIAWPVDGWTIKPDVVVRGAEFKVPKSGIVEWLYVTMPTGFRQDTWVSSMELRTGPNPSLTHHYCTTIVPHRDDVVYGVFSTRNETGVSSAGGQNVSSSASDAAAAASERQGGFEACYEKGQEAFDYRPQHAGRLIPANSDIVFQMHYAPNGTEAIDRPQIGFTVLKERPARQYVFVAVGAGRPINMAPGDAAYKAPPQEGVLTVDAEIAWLQAHAHYRAKGMEFVINYPDGRSETALKVNWNPLWQTIYYPKKVIAAPRGTKLHIEGWYDNSAANKFNPDPTKPVVYGQQASDEMLFPTFGLIIDGAIDLKKTRIVQPAPGYGRDFTPVTGNAAATNGSN